MTSFTFRKATLKDKTAIWNIVQDAILRRKKDGSSQWQDGYPNEGIIENDIKSQAGYVLTDENIVIGYCAVLINNEPEYEKIIGKWITNEDFVVVHRIVIDTRYLGKGLSKVILKNIENHALNNNIKSIKVDTNFDNIPMMKIFDQMGYIYCGEVYFRGSPRRAYEKVLS
ncbi:GNAT family N-acetyltransferase [uncultured Flavobacterium sp.]|uniref:GNAT family N-acetyltransferase n=1 Tax=uncultured Flavobacterium sp. TaxID=165435 RepID=UPI0030C7C8A0